MAGLIRLQWWQDVIQGFEQGQTVAHPVVEGLRRAVVDDGLDPACLRRAIDGRRLPFEEELPSSTDAFEQYLRDVGGSVTCAAAALLGASDQVVSAAADRIGKATAAWEQLCLLEVSTPDRRLWLPLVWLEEQGDGCRRRLEASWLGGISSSRHRRRCSMQGADSRRFTVLCLRRFFQARWSEPVLAIRSVRSSSRSSRPRFQGCSGIGYAAGFEPPVPSRRKLFRRPRLRSECRIEPEISIAIAALHDRQGYRVVANDIEWDIDTRLTSLPEVSDRSRQGSRQLHHRCLGSGPPRPCLHPARGRPGRRV